jgi:hypothetical protein
LCNNPDQIIQYSVLNNSNGSDNDQAELDVVLDRRELQQLYSMAVRPWVQQMLLKAITNVEESLTTIKKTHCRQNVVTLKKSYSEVLVNTKINDERNEEDGLSIPTIITSKNILEDNIQTDPTNI